MTIKQLFPVILITLDIVASGIYLWHGDAKHTIYWLAAAILTATVTF